MKQLDLYDIEYLALIDAGIDPEAQVSQSIISRLKQRQRFSSPALFVIAVKQRILQCKRKLAWDSKFKKFTIVFQTTCLTVGVLYFAACIIELAQLLKIIPYNVLAAYKVYSILGIVGYMSAIMFFVWSTFAAVITYIEYRSR